MLQTVSMDSEQPDRFSALPDDILVKILSFLPTKFSAGTSVLSTRWRFLYVSVVDIDLEDSLFLHERGFNITTSDEELIERGCAERFVQFVSKLFRARNRINISKFRLHCIIPHHQSILRSWLNSAVLYNVRELDLWLKIGENSTLPDEIFACKTLESLRLGTHFCLNVPGSVSLPNLKELTLDFLEVAGEFFFHTVLLGCPVLEDLRMNCLSYIECDIIKICHPRLKNLLISYRPGEGSYYLLLNTPNLQNLLYHTHGDLGFLVCDVKSLAHADISWGSKKDTIVELGDVDDMYIRFHSCLATEFINEMRNVKSIYLSGVSLSALFFSDVPLATFQNLVLMELGVSYVCGWKLLPELLESSPNLEVLVFYEGFLDQESPGKEYEYLLPDIVPACLSQSLREIQIGEFHGQECEYALVEYFLKSAQVLKKLVIGPVVSSKSPFGFTRWAKGRPFFVMDEPQWLIPCYHRLYAAPKCTEACRIEISWKCGTEICGTYVV